MCIAPPALSAHTQALEKDLGRLLERSTRRVELTREGSVLRSRCADHWRYRALDGRGAVSRRQGGTNDQDRNRLSGNDWCSAKVFRPHWPEVLDVALHVRSGLTSDIIHGLENGQINLGFIRPVENIGSLRFFSIAHKRYLLAVEKTSPLALRNEINIEDLREEKIIAFSRQNLSYSERYFFEMF